MPEINVVDGMDSYPAFPSLHLAQALVVLWFMRSYRRSWNVLLALNFFLLLAVVLLEWHYLVDVVGGVLVALTALWLSGEAFPFSALRSRNPTPPLVPETGQK